MRSVLSRPRAFPGTRQANQDIERHHGAIPHATVVGSRQ
jgi:hypothetical protein